MIGIYKITSPSKKIYIGQSRHIHKRFLEYKRLACKRQPILHSSFVKYGVAKHKFEVLIECELDRLNELERYYQDAYSAMGNNGMNCRLTEASDRGAVMSDETKRKLSLSKIGKIPWNKGKKGLYVMPEEIKRKISESTSGEKNHFYGKKLSEYAKSKITRLGWKHSEEGKLKIRTSCKDMGKGVPKSEEHKAKLRGVKHSQDRIQKALNTKKENRLNGLYTKKPKGLWGSKTILNTLTGIFYDSMRAASESVNKREDYLYSKLGKNRKNNTEFILV